MASRAGHPTGWRSCTREPIGCPRSGHGLWMARWTVRSAPPKSSRRTRSSSRRRRPRLRQTVAMIPSEPAPKRRGYRLNRLEAFSDGVFAIAITLLVLELSIPTGSDGKLLQAIIDQWPSYLAYVV